MTINKKCMKKSLLSDYRNLGIGVAFCLVIIGCIWALINLHGQINTCLTIISQPFTAVNVFIVSEIAVIVMCAEIVGTHDAAKSKDLELEKTNTTPIMIFITSFCMGLIFMTYCVVSVVTSMTSSSFPDVIPVLGILLAINAFIVCPLTVAYARCKE